LYQIWVLLSHIVGSFQMLDLKAFYCPILYKILIFRVA
jgi:hypothetical protein